VESNQGAVKLKDDSSICACCYSYDMWWYVARPAGNGCQIQKVVDMGIFHSYRAHLCSTFSVMSLCVVYLFR